MMIDVRPIGNLIVREMDCDSRHRQIDDTTIAKTCALVNTDSWYRYSVFKIHFHIMERRPLLYSVGFHTSESLNINCGPKPAIRDASSPDLDDRLLNVRTSYQVLTIQVSRLVYEYYLLGLELHRDFRIHTIRHLSHNEVDLG